MPPPSHEHSIDIPELTGDAARAVHHRGSHVQIIAGAGSGKTETVAQRVASILAEGVEPEAIVAFTFTQRAGDELRRRIRDRTSAIYGTALASLVSRMRIGTIHSYCHDLLTTKSAKYENYDVLAAFQQRAFVQRMAHTIDLNILGQPSESVLTMALKFVRTVDVIEGELMDVEDLHDPLRAVVEDYYGLLDEHRFLTFGQLIQLTVGLAQDPTKTAGLGTAGIRHVVVDEYQDINPAQETLIQALIDQGAAAELTVVGDDDQSIYQWRGSKVENILSFQDRFPNAARFELLENRRSVREIVRVADAFAQGIEGRLPKQSTASRGPGITPIVVHDDSRDAESEAEWMAGQVRDLVANGVSPSAMAVLVRARSTMPPVVRALEAHGVAVNPTGRSGLFLQPDGEFLGRVIAWLGSTPWRQARFEAVTGEVMRSDIEGIAEKLYDMTPAQSAAMKSSLTDLRRSATSIAATSIWFRNCTRCWNRWACVTGP